MKPLSLLTGSLLCFSSFAQLPNITWNEYTIIDPLMSPGFIDVGDANGDGKLDVFLSTLMEEGSAANQATTKGAIRYFSYNPTQGISGPWTETMVLPTSTNLPFINAPQFMDVDQDGIKDILVQQGFIQTNGGSHSWLKGPSYTQRFDFAATTAHGSTDYFWHESDQFDLDNDGKKDIISTSANNEVSPTEKKIDYYRNLGNGNFSHHIICDTLGGVFIKLHDIDGDLDEDIIVSQFFGFPGSAPLVWLENIAAPASSNNYEGVWEYHVIDNTTGLGYYFDFYDIDADGTEELVYDNHNNIDNNSIVDGSGNPIQSGIYYFEIPSDPAASSQWDKVVIYEGFPIDAFDFGNPSSQGSPGIFDIGDVDGNGYPDVVVPGDGTDDLFLIRQSSTGTWTKETIATGRMFGMALIRDLDQNGDLEIVATMHDFPEAWEILFPPKGHLKVYDPDVEGLKVNELSAGELSVVPNPSVGIVTLKSSEMVYSIDLYNAVGQKVYSKAVNAFEAKIDLTNLSSGCYTVRANTDKGLISKTVLIK